MPSRSSKLYPALTAVFTTLLPVSAPAAILLNEIHLRTPASTDTVPNDRNYEFVELRSTTGGVEACTNMWILVIDNEGGSVGEIKQAWPLRHADGTWMQTGTNGLLLLGDDYIKPDSPWASVKAPQTTMGDPSGMGTDDLPDADGISILLVTNYTNPAPLVAGEDVDIDMDNDGTGVPDWLDPTPPAVRYTTPLWSTVVDSIGFNGDQGAVIKVAYTGAAASLSTSNAAKGVPVIGGATTFYPHSFARSASNNTANSRTAWYGGTISGASSAVDSVIYGTSAFNLIASQTWRGQVTPGQPNFSSAPVAPVFRINEINVNPPGTPGRSPSSLTPAAPEANDGNFEYIEIVNTLANQSGGSNFSGSLANFTLLMIDSGGAATGRVMEAWNLGRYATGSNGLLLIGDDYNLGTGPFGGLYDVNTQLADPGSVAGAAPNQNRLIHSSFNMGDLVNNGVTYLLVQNWTGFVDDDVDSNDDGVLNTTVPWSSTVDSVSIPEIDNNGALVAGRGGYTAVRPDILVGGRHYNADNLSRLRGVNTVATAAWSAGAFGSNDPHARIYRNGFNITGTAPAFRTAATPGFANHNNANQPAPGTFLLNEVHVDPPTATDNTEYIEVLSTTPHALMTNLWIIVIDASTGGSGRVRKVIDLRGQATGSNRLAVFADGIEEDASVLVPFLSGRTVRDDPASFNADGTANDSGGYNFTPDSLPNDGVSVLLVSYTPPTATGVPATPDADLDSNNDGTLDTTPAWTLIDGISTGNGVGGAPVPATSGFTPGSLCRTVGTSTVNSAAAWYGGELTGGTATSFGYGANFFGSFKGAASPGRHNVTATPSATGGLLLNEVNINPPGGDNNKEFIEFISTANSAMSTLGWSVLLVDNDGNDTGRILKVYDLDSAATGSNGLLLAGVDYTTSMPWTDTAAPAPATSFFSPDTMSLDDIGLSTDNGAITVLLVRNFQGRVGDDLDQGTQDNWNLADDHVFNTPVPWATLSDSVAMQAFTATADVPPVYSLAGFIFPGTANLTVPIPPAPNQANGYTPDTVARLGGNVSANDAAAWYGANIQGTAATSTVYEPTQFFPSTLQNGKVTPGQPNIQGITDSSDPDGDGVIHLMEQALGMDSFTPDNGKLPQPAWDTLNNVGQPVFKIARPTGGTAGITYTIQASFNLQSWTLPTVLSSTQANTPSAGMETLTYAIDPTFLPLLSTNKRVYYRLKVARQ